MKILIIGGGHSGRRFCEGLLLFSKNEIFLCSASETGKTIALAQEYNLKFILIDDLQKYVNNFDIIIIAVPIGNKHNIFEMLIKNYGYRKSVILEKPLSLEMDHIHKIHILAKTANIKYIVAYNRRYMSIDKFLNQDLLEIQFPIVDRENALVHGLPHAIDFTMLLLEDIYLIINRIDINCGNCVIYGCGQKNKFILKIYISNRKENMVRVNDNDINWPSLKVHNQMIKKLNTISMEEVDNNFKKEIIILTIMKEVIGYYETKKLY